MDYPEYPYLAHLLRQPSVGSATLRILLQRVTDLSSVVGLDPGLMQAWGIREDAAVAVHQAGPPADRGFREAEWLESAAVRVVSIVDPDYPELLRQIPAAPPVLFVQGSVDCLSGPLLAMVGSRKPTHAGCSTAQSIAAGVVDGGMGICSGLAIGIDTCSHEGALAGGGITVAVTGTGPDQVYPLRNRALARRIVDGGGALVTEFLPGTAPAPDNFPRRNRIISGLSLGVLVVEAALPSGSLLTVGYAVEQNREVLAVPGSVHSMVSRGTNNLLREGAALVECAADVFDALSFHEFPVTVVEDEAAPGHSGLAPDAPILGVIGFEPTGVNDIVERSGLPVAEVLAELARLELAGLVQQAGGQVQRIGRALAPASLKG